MNPLKLLVVILVLVVLLPILIPLVLSFVLPVLLVISKPIILLLTVIPDVEVLNNVLNVVL